MGVRLRSPRGVVVTTSERNADRLITFRGYVLADETPKPVEQPAPKRRGRPKKTTES